MLCIVVILRFIIYFLILKISIKSEHLNTTYYICKILIVLDGIYSYFKILEKIGNVSRCRNDSIQKSSPYLYIRVGGTLILSL